MKELLQDNISLLAQLEEVQGLHSLHMVGATRPRLREVSSLLLPGLHHHLNEDPVTRDQLAYTQRIIKQAQSQGGMTWLDYDRAFHQQKAVNPAIFWNTLNPSLLAATSLGQRPGYSGSFCTLCRSTEYNRAHCALSYLEPQTPYAAPPRVITPQRVHPGPPSSPTSVPLLEQGRLPPKFGWCNCQHVCAKCRVPSHKASTCLPVTSSAAYQSAPLPTSTSFRHP